MTIVILAHLRGGAVVVAAVSKVSLAWTLARLQCARDAARTVPASLRRHGAIYVMCTYGNADTSGLDSCIGDGRSEL